MSIGGLPALNDGNNARARPLRPPHRQLRRADVHLRRQQGPGHEHHRRPVGRHQVMSVGSYIYERHLAENYGSTSAHQADNLHHLLLARAARGRRLQAEYRRPRLGHLHDPGLAGGGRWPACLRAAARLRDVQRHVDGLAAGGRRRGAPAERGEGDGVAVTPTQFRQAFNSTARSGPRYQALDQGNGLIDVGAAWDAAQARSRRPRSPRPCRSTRPARVPRDPGIGVGHLRPGGGGSSGHFIRHYTFARTSGHRPADLQAALGRERRDVLSATSVDAEHKQPSRSLPVIGPRPVSTRRSSPSTTRPPPGIDHQTMNTVSSPHSSRREQLIDDEGARRTADPACRVLLLRAARRVGVQGRRAERRRRARASSASCATTRTACRLERTATRIATAGRRPARPASPWARSAAP